MKSQTRQKYLKKVQGCTILANSKSKKVSVKEIRDAAKAVGLPYEVMNYAWGVFQETGGKFVDRRIKNTKGGTILNLTPTVVGLYPYNTNINTWEAGKVVKSYMLNNDRNSRELSNTYKISVEQFYDWLHELSVKGTLLGRRVLNPNKYAKPYVVDVIWFYKHPNTKRKSIVNLTDLQKENYKRVAAVLLAYL